MQPAQLVLLSVLGGGAWGLAFRSSPDPILGWISERKLCIEPDGRIIYDQARLESPIVFDN